MLQVNKIICKVKKENFKLEIKENIKYTNLTIYNIQSLGNLLECPVKQAMDLF